MKSRYARFSPEWWEWMTTPEPNSGCLLWLGSVCKNGYGRVAYKGASSHVLIHRIAYERAKGPITRGAKVLHSCDTPSCVNPDHLSLGTQLENMRDMFKKGRGRPYGSGVKRLRIDRSVSAPLAPVPVSSENPHAGVKRVIIIHHICTICSHTSTESVAPETVEAVPAWCRVVGVPAYRPTQAIQLWKRPLEWTDFQGLSSPQIDHGREAVSLLQVSGVGARGRRT